MSLTFWLGMVLLIGGIVMYIFSQLVNPWAWIIVAVIGAVVAIVGTSYTKSTTSMKSSSKRKK